jgi:putative flippase GtrA
MKKKLKKVKETVIDTQELVKIKLTTYEGRRRIINYVHNHPFTWFAIGGTIGFVSEILLTIFLTEVFGVWHMVSYGISLLLGLVFLYFFYAHYTFGRFDKMHRRMFKFFSLMCGSYIINWWIVFLLSDRFLLHYGAAIVLAVLVMSLLNYYLNMYWVFRKYQVYE